jgi:hypothetical protein
MLRDQAAKNGKVGRGMGAYVKYAMARFESLTVADLEDFSVTPEEFAAWRKSFFPPPPPAAPKRVLVGPDPRAAAGANDVADQSPDPLPEEETTVVRTVRAALPRPPAQSAPRSAAPVAVTTPEIDPFTAEGVLQAMHHGNAEAYKKKAFAVIKTLLTPLRIGICLSIAIALRLSLRELLSSSSLSGLIVFPLSGLAWLYFRWLDETESNPLTGREALIILLAGGAVSIFVSNGVMAILYSLLFATR